MLGGVLSGLDALEPNTTEHSILWTTRIKTNDKYNYTVDPETVKQEPKPPQEAYKWLTTYMAENTKNTSSSRRSGIDKCVEEAGRKLEGKSGKKSIVILTDNRDCSSNPYCTYSKEFQSVGEKAGDLEKGIQLLAYILPYTNGYRGWETRDESYSKKEMSKCPLLSKQQQNDYAHHLQWIS